MAKLEPYAGNYYLWRYLPSIPAAAIFSILFLIATIATLWRMCRTKTWFCTAFVVGGLFEIIGYATRIVSHNNTAQVMPYALQNVFILVAPILFAASIYMTLSRIIRRVHGEKHSLIRPHLLTKIFVTGDILAFTIQGGAAGLMIVQDLASTGQAIVIGGLVFHIVIFGIFWATAAIFQIRIRHDALAVNSIPGNIKWEQLLYMLYGSSALIMTRSVFRMIEFIMGHDGYLLSTEWPLYVFDSMPMLTVMVIFFWWFPSTLQARGSSWREVSVESTTSFALAEASVPLKELRR